MAAVGDTPIGIDIEQFQMRSPHFCSRYFHTAERALIGDDALKVNILWAIKEAVLKLFGLGLRVSPLDIQIQELGDSHAVISVHGNVAALFRSNVANFVRIRYRQVHNYCMAMACWSAHAPPMTSFQLEAFRVAA